MSFRNILNDDDQAVDTSQYAAGFVPWNLVHPAQPVAAPLTPPSTADSPQQPQSAPSGGTGQTSTLGPNVARTSSQSDPTSSQPALDVGQTQAPTLTAGGDSSTQQTTPTPAPSHGTQPTLTNVQTTLHASQQTGASDPGAGPSSQPSGAVTAAVPADGRDEPFSRLHMIQAGRGDSLLLEFRVASDSPVQYWLIDGGDQGQRYETKEKHAIEHLFYTLNSFPRKDPSSSSVRTQEPLGLACIDRLVVTHPDQDHIVGIDGILQSLAPGWDDVANIPKPRRVYCMWTLGEKRIAGGELPFLRIWYNDQVCLDANFDLSDQTTSTTSTAKPTAVAIPTRYPGWMVADLDTGNADLGLRPSWKAKGMDLEAPNQYVNTELLLTGNDAPKVQGYNGDPYGIVSRERAEQIGQAHWSPARIVSPGDEQLRKSAEGFSSALKKNLYLKARRPDEGTVSNKTRELQKWALLNQLDVDENTAEANTGPRNAMSIVFDFEHNGQRCLLTGDSTGKLMRQGLSAAAQASAFQCWDIIKLPHHGSCYNCCLTPSITAPGAKINQSAQNYAFFKFFKAKTYCISSDPFSATPNPDIYTLGSLIDGYVDWTGPGVGALTDAPNGWETLSIVLTNGCSSNSWQILQDRATENNVQVRVLFMKRTAPFCSTDAKAGPLANGLTEIMDRAQFRKRYKRELTLYAAALRSISPSDVEKLSEDDLRKIEATLGKVNYEQMRDQEGQVVSTAVVPPTRRQAARNDDTLQKMRAGQAQWTQSNQTTRAVTVNKRKSGRSRASSVASDDGGASTDGTAPTMTSTSRKRTASVSSSKAQTSTDTTDTFQVPLPKTRRLEPQNPTPPPTPPSIPLATDYFGAYFQNSPSSAFAPSYGMGSQPTHGTTGAPYAGQFVFPSAYGGAGNAYLPPATSNPYANTYAPQTYHPPATSSTHTNPYAPPIYNPMYQYNATPIQVSQFVSRPPGGAPQPGPFGPTGTSQPSASTPYMPSGMPQTFAFGQGGTPQTSTSMPYAPGGMPPSSMSGQHFPPYNPGSQLAETPRPINQKTFVFECQVGAPVASQSSLQPSCTKVFWAQADQGSELNLIMAATVAHLGLQRHDLSELGFRKRSLKMRTADRRELCLEKFVYVSISVAGIWRNILCVVNPAEFSQDDVERAGSADILLGIPWLFDVNAVLRVRNFELDVGDPERGESIRTILGSKHQFGYGHTLLMCPDINATGKNGLEQVSLVPQVCMVETTTENDTKTPPSESEETKPLTLSQVWHDLTVSQFALRDLPSWGYFSDGPTPALGSYGSIYWVDMSQLIYLLRVDSAIPATDGRPAPNDQSFQQLANWFPGSGGYPGNADTILGVFLSAFFDTNAATHIITALPLSANGPASNAADPAFAATTFTAISKLPIYDIRWEVVPPSPDGSTRLQANEPLSWVVPFCNTSYAHGQIQLVHDCSKGIRVKLLWPFYQNRSMIAHFDSTFMLYKRKTGNTLSEMISLPCTGKTYMKTLKSSCMATYDIQFGDMDLLDAFDHFSPLKGRFQTTLGKALQKLGISSLTNFVNKAVTFKVRDLGILFQQVSPELSAVDLSDLYGTLDPSECKTTIELPGANWKFPLDDLPAVTLGFGNIAGTSDHTASIALAKGISDLGFAALQGTYSTSKCRSQFDATILCGQGVSLGQILDRGLDIISPHFFDDKMMSCLHSSSLNPKAIADVAKDILNEILVPRARVQVASLPSGTFGITELDIQLQLRPVQFPEANPVLQLREFELQIFQERSGGALPGDSNPGNTAGGNSSVTSVTSVNGTATITLGGIDADVKFAYNPDNDIANRMALNPAPPSSGRQLILETDFPAGCPAIGDIVNQIVGEVSKLSTGGSCAARIPQPLVKVLDIAALEMLQFTLASDKMENSPWYLSSVYARIDILELVEDINIFGDNLQFEDPRLSVRVDNPTTASQSFDVRISSFIGISDVLCDIVADIAVVKTQDSPTVDTVRFSFDWDPAKGTLSLGHILGLLESEIIGASSSQSYIEALTELVPESLRTLINEIDMRDVRIMVADFSTDPSKHRFELATISVDVTANEKPWSPFGDGWSHLSFSNTTLGYQYYSGKLTGDSTTTTTSKGTTSVNFATQMVLASRTLNVEFGYSNSATSTSFQLTLTEDTGKDYTLMDLIGDMLNDIAGVKSIKIPDDAKDIFDISLESLMISYTRNKTPSGIVESISFTQSGGATILGVSFSTISIVCNKAAGAWGYDLQFQLQHEVKPLARILPIPGIEDLTVIDGAFSILKGPANVPSKISYMINQSGGDGVSIFLSGGIKLGGNDFMDLVGTIVKVPEVDFALQNNGTLSIAIPVGKLELSIAGHPMFSVQNFLLQVAQGNILLSAEMDFLCEWLAPSIKDHPIGFRFALGIGVDGSLDISIYAVDPATGIQYPDMSKDQFIVRPFWIPGLVLYPFHFSMRWLAEEEVPEAVAAGGGFGILNSPISNVFAKLTQSVTLSSMFGVLFPGNDTLKKIFSIVDIGFYTLDVNIYPAQKQFHVYANFVLLVLKGIVIADVDPTSGFVMGATANPVDLGNGLIKLVSYTDPTKGPFVHVNTNVKDMVTGSVPTNPATPEWAGLTTNDPRLDHSTFAMTAKFHFLALELDIFGLLDHSGLLLMTYMGVGANLPGMSVLFHRQMDISISSTQFYAMASMGFDLEFDIPTISVAGVRLGSFPHQSITLNISISLTIKYDKDNWLNDGLVYEASFICHILGLSLDIPHMEIEVTVKELKDLPSVVEHFIRDKVIDFLEDKIVNGAKEVIHDVEKVGKEAVHGIERIGSEVVDTMTQDFNVAEHDVAHAFTEVGQSAEQTALTLKHDLGMGVDETVGVFVGLGHDISHFGDAVANAFGVSKAAVIGSAVLQGACSVEHAIAAGLNHDLDDVKAFGSGIVGFATDLGNLANKGLDDLEKGVQKAAQEAEQGVKEARKDIEHGAETAGHAIETGAKKAGHDIENDAKKAGHAIEKGAEDTGHAIEHGAKTVGHAIAHGAETVVNVVKKTCVVM